MFRIILPALFATGLAAADLPVGLFVAEPVSAAHMEVIAARVAPQPGAEITVTGVIGGRPKPFVEGRAVFTIMDRSLVCSSGCGTAWSGCSLPPEQLRGGVATVQVVAADGKPLAAAIEGAGGLVPGATVVISGTVAAGSGEKALIVTAQAIHVAAADVPKPH
jgi:hypothetical protein